MIQGLKEVREGLQLSDLCNVKQMDVPVNQMSFINVIIEPTFKCLGHIAPSIANRARAWAAHNKGLWTDLA